MRVTLERRSFCPRPLRAHLKGTASRFVGTRSRCIRFTGICGLCRNARSFPVPSIRDSCRGNFPKIQRHRVRVSCYFVTRLKRCMLARFLAQTREAVRAGAHARKRSTKRRKNSSTTARGRPCNASGVRLLHHYASSEK